MKYRTIVLGALSLLCSAVSAVPKVGVKPNLTRRAANCSSGFKKISANDFVNSLTPGWNLGNTLDATETEGAWNNPPVVLATFDDIKATGFRSVRIPVTWHYHVTGQSPDWTIDSVWLQRVSDVIDMSISRGFYTIVNVHHDSWIWADVTQPNANLTMIHEKFYTLWRQIGEKLACKSELLAYEPINEPPGTTPEHGAQINIFNDLFLKAINEAGGYNPSRVVTLVGAGEDGAKTSQWFKFPTGNYSNPTAIQYHYYSPYDFIFAAWGKTIWGSEADKAALEADIAAVRGNFTNTPLLIGEWEASPQQTETAARWKYFDFFVRTATKYNTATIIWDNGDGIFDRTAHQPRDPIALQIYQNAAGNDENSLPDSTEDGSTSQFTSAYIFHKVWDNITDTTLPFLFNGNTLEHVLWNDAALSPIDDYILYNDTTITFKADFLTKIFNTRAPGIRANLTVSFNTNDLALQAVQWDMPMLGLPNVNGTGSKAKPGSDLRIPITWTGLHRLAAVRAVKSDGGYLVDDWTQWLPPLQEGRLTYNSHFRWDESSVTLTSDAVAAVVAAGKDTTFTFEFFPRVQGNAVNYTLTV